MTNGQGNRGLASAMVGATFVMLAAAIAEPAWAQTNQVPFINEPLVPTAVAPGGPGFTLTVNGTGFVSGSVVNWNGSALTTTFVSSSRLTASVPAADIGAAGSASIEVTSPGGVPSNVEYFRITNLVSPVVFVASAICGPSTCGYLFPLAAADFNGDGKLDLLVSDDNYLYVLLGNGDGTFSSPLYTSFAATNSVAIGDFNGDGKLDIATTTIAIYLGNGDGTFTAGPLYYNSDNNESIVTADFNGDGKLDLGVPNNGDGYGPYMVMLFGNGDGTFTFAPGANTGGWGPPAVGDFNGDGKLDVAEASDIFRKQLRPKNRGRMRSNGYIPNSTKNGSSLLL